VKVHGVLLALIDVPPELTADYNRWYDLDHLPEHASKPDVLLARRYVAPADLRGLGRTIGDLTGGHPAYLTTYLLGAPDFDAEAVAATWREKDKALARSGRFFRAGSVPFARRMRLRGARTRASVAVSEDAIPYLAHRGVLLALARTASSWDATALAIDGVIASLRFESVGAGDALTAHLVLTDDDPAVVMPRIGGTPADLIALLPYRRIVPLEYDFTW
jgi:hypothetical protein